MMQENETRLIAVIKGGIRSISASFPGFASLGQAWSEYESRLQLERIENYFNDLRNEMMAEKDKIKAAEKRIIDSGEFPVMIERTVQKVKREASVQKRKAFARLLARSLSAEKNISYDDKLDFIETLDTLTDRDVWVLFKFAPGASYRVKEMEQSIKFRDIPKIGIFGTLINSLSKLETRGLISETSSHRPTDIFSHSGDIDYWVNRWKKKYYELLPYGIKFIKIVKK